MTIASDVPLLLRSAVEWLKVEDLCDHLSDFGPLERLQWKGLLMDTYSCQWWDNPGSEPAFINSWDAEYTEDLRKYKTLV